jgi:hypothetical protein
MGRERDPKSLPSQIVEVVRRSQLPISVAEIAEQLGETTAAINKRMTDLYKAGRLKRSDILRYGKVRDCSRELTSHPEQFKPVKQDTESEPVTLLELFEGKDQVDLLDACEKLDVSPGEIRGMLQDTRARDGIEIAEIDGKLVMGVTRRDKPNPLADRKIKFGVASDMHLGSKSTQITALNEFVKDCIKAGVTHILVPGDVTDGTGIFPGQDLHQYAQTAEAQLYSAVKNLPRGVEWIVLGGNHDYSWMSKARGYNILARLETEREDVTFIGFDRAIVPLLPGVDAMLWHGRGGGAYAKSYKLQNHVRNIAFDELRKFLNDDIPPSIRFLFGGHWHVFAEVEDGGIECFLCGAFSGRTNLTDQMGVSCIIRGLVIETEIDCRGRIKRLRCDKLTYPEITDDWKNYDHEPQARKILTPVFG